VRRFAVLALAGWFLFLLKMGLPVHQVPGVYPTGVACANAAHALGYTHFGTYRCVWSK